MKPKKHCIYYITDGKILAVCDTIRGFKIIIVKLKVLVDYFLKFESLHKTEHETNRCCILPCRSPFPRRTCPACVGSSASWSQLRSELRTQRATCPWSGLSTAPSSPVRPPPCPLENTSSSRKPSPQRDKHTRV